MTYQRKEVPRRYNAKVHQDVTDLAFALDDQPKSESVYLAACILGAGMMRCQWWLRASVAIGAWRSGEPKAIIWARIMSRFPEIASQTVNETVNWMRWGKDADGEGVGGFNQREIDQMAALLGSQRTSDAA